MFKKRIRRKKNNNAKVEKQLLNRLWILYIWPQNKCGNNLNNRKLSANCDSKFNNNSVIRRKSVENEENQKVNKKKKQRKGTEEFYMIFASKNFFIMISHINI